MVSAAEELALLLCHFCFVLSGEGCTESIISCGSFSGPAPHRKISCDLLEAVQCLCRGYRYGKAPGERLKGKVCTDG